MSDFLEAFFSMKIVLMNVYLFQRSQNPRLSHVLHDLDFDERPTRRGKNNDDDDDDDLCSMMDRLPGNGNKRR